MVVQLLSGVLAGVVGLGSVALYLAAFFFPEVHRRHDFFWSGVGCFYALVLWLDAGQITPTELLGHLASISLMGWLGWQTLALRRKRTPLSLQTPYTADSWPTLRREMTALGLDALRQTPLRRWLPDPNQTASPVVKGIRISALKEVGYEFVDSVESPAATVAKAGPRLSRGRSVAVPEAHPPSDPAVREPQIADPMEAAAAATEPVTTESTHRADSIAMESVATESIAADAVDSVAPAEPVTTEPGDAEPAVAEPAGADVLEAEPSAGNTQTVSLDSIAEPVEAEPRVARPVAAPTVPQRPPSLGTPPSTLGSSTVQRPGGQSSGSPRRTMTWGQRAQGLATWVQDLVRAKTTPKPKKAVIEIPPRPSSLAKRSASPRRAEAPPVVAETTPSQTSPPPDKPSPVPSPPRPDYAAPETSNWEDEDEDWI